MKTTIGKLFLVFCCISLVLCFAFISNANAGDENGRIEGEAEITCLHHVNFLDIDLEECGGLEIYGLADCKIVENANMTKVSCKGQALPVKWKFIFPLPQDANSAIPVELEECKASVCTEDGSCRLRHGYGQATLAANYKEIIDLGFFEIESANVSVTCFFPEDKD